MFKQIYETIPSSAWTLVAHVMPRRRCTPCWPQQPPPCRVEERRHETERNKAATATATFSSHTDHHALILTGESHQAAVQLLTLSPAPHQGGNFRAHQSRQHCPGCWVLLQVWNSCTHFNKFRKTWWPCPRIYSYKADYGLLPSSQPSRSR